MQNGFEKMDKAIKTVASLRPDLIGTAVGDYLARSIGFALAYGKRPITRDVVLRHPHGIPYLYGTIAVGQKRPRGYRKQRDKQCFENALWLARERSLTYVEGFAESLIAVSHAWCMDETGRVIDPTWRNPEGKQYLGVALPVKAVGTWIVRNGYYGIFENMWLGHVSPDEIVAAIKGGDYGKDKSA